MKSLMVTWEEPDSEGEDEEANLALMASTFSDSESDAGSKSESKDTEPVFSNISESYLSTLCHNLMERCY